jgi:hypothetical protein
LWLRVSVNDITLCILETPGSNDQGIAFPYPDPFLHLSFDSAQAGDPVSIDVKKTIEGKEITMDV